MSDGPPVPACPYCRSLQAERYRGWAVFVAVCDGCGKVYTYPPSDSHQEAASGFIGSGRGIDPQMTPIGSDEKCENPRPSATSADDLKK